MKKPLTALETAAFSTIVDTHHESDGWLDLTRICSRTARHLAEFRRRSVPTRLPLAPCLGGVIAGETS